MGVFNFMETFFFLSLGITFVLILLLVYHFKQRLTTVETKSDTMFEIMNTMVKEMGVIKTMASRAVSMPMQMPMPPQFSMPMGGSIPLDQVFSQFGQTVHASADNINVTALGDKIQSISDDEVSINEHASDSDNEESSDEDSSDDEEGSSDEEEDTKPVVHNSLNLDSSKIVVSDTEDLVEDVLEEVIDETTKPPRSPSPSAIPLASEDLVETQLVEETPLDNDNVVVSQEAVGQDADDMSVISELSLDNTLDTQSKTATDFRKMNLGELKQLALTKGLVQDAGKMKKKELLELLRTTVA